MTSRDRELGMHRRITRRDLLHGAGVLAAASMLPSGLLAGESAVARLAPTYPPGLTGLRGSHVGAFEVAHQLAREGRRDWGPFEKADSITYDLAVVGAGISGLSAAYFYKQQHPDARILILDNHDDFGGHAKRNEFEVDGRRLIGYGGAQSLEAPSDYPEIVKELLRDLGVKLDSFYNHFDHEFFRRHGLAGGVFFNRDAWGKSRLIRVDLGGIRDTLPLADTSVSAEEAVAAMPLSDAARREMLHLLTLEEDRLPGLTVDERFDYLGTISYRDFLAKHIGITEDEVFDVFRELGTDTGASIEAVTAIGALFYVGLPGYEAAGLPETDDEPYIHHFPDGNASIARLLVRSMVPAVAAGKTMDDVVLADFDYAKLDVDGALVRVRLNSTVVNVEHDGKPASASAVTVRYVNAGRAYEVSARHCVMACDHAIVSHVCPELPTSQREALNTSFRVPMLYTNVVLRHWRAFKKLGIGAVSCPGGYYVNAMLDFPVSMGGYAFAENPDDPVIVHMERFTGRGDEMLTKREQSRIGRAELLATPFETIERNTRSELAELLGDAGFDPAEDIAAITANRWPHGYTGRDWLEDDWFEDPDDIRYPHVRGRQPFGRLAIANSDAGGAAILHAAVMQAHRAVGELLG